MLKISNLIILFVLFCAALHGQALPIAIDSEFEDWATASAGYTDPTGDASSIDLLRFEVANDENYLYLRFGLSGEVVLTDNNDLALFLDTDHNALTGKSVNGIGAELELDFGNLEGRFYTGNSSFFLQLNDVKFHHQPTVSSKIFEMAIGRDLVLAGNNSLFPGNKIRIVFRNGIVGDLMPDAGQIFTYTFDNTPTPPTQPVGLQKDNPKYLRLLTWNTLQNGLDDFNRQEHFKRVLSVLKPDIVTFNECWDVTPGMAATLLNESVPLGNFQSWTAVKLDQGNITVSRYPILQNWQVYPGHRLTASLINLPDNLFSTDLLVINGHLKCCSDGNYTRQQEADAFASFILDAKAPGGAITLPEGTPFVLSGDLNLVGWQQQLTTLLTGDIVNTNTFGSGSPLDWDDTDLQDVIALQADQRMAYTWRSDFSSYPPSRIDFHICSNSVMEVKKAFTLQTEIMTPERLAEYGLQADDTHLASDHLPKVTDFELGTVTTAAETPVPGLELKVLPNPTDRWMQVRLFLQESTPLYCILMNMEGQVILEWQETGKAGFQILEKDLSAQPAGVYFFSVQTEGGSRKTVRVIKV